jgi:Nucleotidyltransferase/DNA polymerase involved in DNA repair
MSGHDPGGTSGNDTERDARRIVHVDMDAFYAQIEQRDFPGRYAGKPIAVGGDPPRGVVQTASYEARSLRRAFGAAGGGGRPEVP